MAPEILPASARGLGFGSGLLGFDRRMGRSEAHVARRHSQFGFLQLKQLTPLKEQKFARRLLKSHALPVLPAALEWKLACKHSLLLHRFCSSIAILLPAAWHL